MEPKSQKSDFRIYRFYETLVNVANCALKYPFLTCAQLDGFDFFNEEVFGRFSDIDKVSIHFEECDLTVVTTDRDGNTVIRHHDNRSIVKI